MVVYLLSKLFFELGINYRLGNITKIPWSAIQLCITERIIFLKKNLKIFKTLPESETNRVLELKNRLLCNPLI
jgi:hypothetical protein